MDLGTGNGLLGEQQELSVTATADTGPLNNTYTHVAEEKCRTHI